MKSLRTIEEVCEQQEGIVYVVAALPEWEHYSATECPIPIKDWIAANYPDIAIEQVASLGREWAPPRLSAHI